MPGIDGLALVAELRASKRTAQIPILLLSARAGQEAAIEGLRAGADDYLVKPFSAAELLARARTTIELARLRGRHAAWRTAIVDALEAGFFFCDTGGNVLEINDAFTDILGYDRDGLPYAAPDQPWWPDPELDPAAYRRVREVFELLVREGRGTATIPLAHKDGHRVWVAVTFATTEDPDTGERMIAGSFRDVTDEHYAIQRETALSALGWQLAKAASLDDALAAALCELRDMWHADRVLAIAFPTGEAAPAVCAAGSRDSAGAASVTALSWDDLDEQLRAEVNHVAAQPLLLPVTTAAGDTGISLDHPAGRLVLLISLQRRFTEQDRTLLAVLGGHLAGGLRRAHQFDQQRETALALQHAILGPSRLPPGFAVCYEPATRPLQVGGDWYDIVDLPGDRIGIVVGDCVGRGLQAATVMGQLRSACQAMLLHTADPAVTLTALDAVTTVLPNALCTSVFCAVLDPASGDLHYSSAGHPPALLADDDGTVTVLDGGHHPVLGVAARPRTNALAHIGDRAALLLYTDGLVERRRQTLDTGIDAAAAALARHRRLPVRELADATLAALAPPDGYTDDVALLVHRPVTPLHLTYPASPGRLAASRHAVRDWLTEHDIADHITIDVLHAVGEACANAIEHAHSAGAAAAHPPTVTIVIRVLGGTLSLTVADNGRWRPPPPDNARHRGRGLIMMWALMDEVTVEPGPDGTTVRMRKALDRQGRD
ncbi:SpoIIE family protein phosphatase [Nocardia yunnanensis]|uniref:SpoIIE family protein phosphatase n=1 Tax=Nocardia yunnanensis TaxID=2382165 RepID=UPI00248314A4|nr:SpoIIE family protein phosphatase [Nocardia yunnanensis]